MLQIYHISTFLGGAKNYSMHPFKSPQLCSFQMESKWDWEALLRSRHKNDPLLMPHDLHIFSS
jgi:hypothetical protein